MTRNPILVIGSSRSGTTLLTRVLRASGVFMGADLESNQESKSVQGVNRWIYLNACAGLESPERVDLLLRDPFLRRAACDAIEATVGAWAFLGWRSVRRPAVWGVKDPRTTFTLPLWLDVFPEARVLHMVRGGRDVARSLVARRARAEAAWSPRKVRRLLRQQRVAANLVTSTIEGLALWRRYRERGDRHVQELGPARAHVVAYERLVEAPDVVTAELGAFLDRVVTAAGVPIRGRHHPNNPSNNPNDRRAIRLDLS